MMKSKKFCAAIALGVAATSLFAACSAAQPTQFNARWRKAVTDASENVDLGGATETAEYDVSFEKGANETYSVNYANGKYKTELSAVNGNYVYKTALTVDVSYTFGGETAEFAGENGDTVTSEVVVKSTQNGLKPVSSLKKVAAHVPASAAPVALSGNNGCYREYFYTVSTDYSANSCTIEYFADKSFETPHATYQKQTRTFEHDGKYSLIDNEELLLAVRAIEKTATLSVYNTAAGKMQNVSVSKGSSEKTGFSFLIAGKDETAQSRDIAYAVYSLTISDTNPGATQKVWVASTADAQNNEFRNAILKIEAPVSFNLGTLVYTLSSVDFLDD